MFSFIKNLLLGILIGIVIAPDRGSKTRKKVIDIFENAIDNAKEVVNR